MFDPNQVVPATNYPMYMQSNPIQLDDLDDELQAELYQKLMAIGNLTLAETMHGLGFKCPSGPISDWAAEEMTEFMFQAADNNPLLTRVMLRLAGMQVEIRK